MGTYTASCIAKINGGAPQRLTKTLEIDEKELSEILKGEVTEMIFKFWPEFKQGGEYTISDTHLQAGKALHFSPLKQSGNRAQRRAKLRK